MSQLIREHTDKDRSEIIRLLEELQDYLVKIDPIRRLIRGTDFGPWYADRTINEVNRKHGRIFVAEKNKSLSGFIAGIIEDDGDSSGLECKAHRDGRITELVVTECERGSGVGHQLMAAMEGYFSQQDCDLIRVEVFSPNHPAIDFYSTQGYSARVLDLVKVLKTATKV